MNPWHPYHHHIKLHVPGRISPEDARRQERTAQEILRRLAYQPGVVLADEVGMGKTFVALAVAVSVALADQGRPVVVMVPPSLREKWPRDFEVFRRECLRGDAGQRLNAASADRGLDFLKLLDDPPKRWKSIIFLTHGALHRGLGRGMAGGWMKLAWIQCALRYRKSLHGRKDVPYRRLGEGLEMSRNKRLVPGVWKKLLSAPCSEWLSILQKSGIDPEGDKNRATDDDPVPAAVARTLKRFDPDQLLKVRKALQKIPNRDSASYTERLVEARKELNEALDKQWRNCLRNLRLRLPLLIFDEAHHLKNAETDLASIFQVPEAKADADEIARGPLEGVFERMLFLTETPFQLGHHELGAVRERFEGICWREPYAPRAGRESFQKQMQELRQRLDAAPEAARCFDAAWGKLTWEDLVIDGESCDDVEHWWARIRRAAPSSPVIENVLACHRRSGQELRAAEAALKPWVIRHRRPGQLTGPFSGKPRRQRLPGRSILEDGQVTEAGLEIPQNALLPLLLATRAALCLAESRPVFAEGLASSYEAVRYIRQHNAGLDGDSEPVDEVHISKAAEWYLAQLERTIPLGGPRASLEHPKVAATAERVLRLWQKGKKVRVFCHFIHTGRALRRVISARLHEEILKTAAQKLRCAPRRAARQLQLMSRRFFDADYPVRRECERQISQLLRGYPRLKRFAPTLREILQRYVRTPAFLARFVPLSRRGLKPPDIQAAFGGDDGPGKVCRAFLDFLQEHCTREERDAYLAALRHIQTGDMPAGKPARVTRRTNSRGGSVANRRCPTCAWSTAAPSPKPGSG